MRRTAGGHQLHSVSICVFYVVALLFIVFEVEMAFFFPPAVVFGKLTQILGLYDRPNRNSR